MNPDRILRQVESLGRDLYYKKMRYDRALAEATAQSWKLQNPQAYAQFTADVFRKLADKAQSNQQFANKYMYTAADLFRYAAAAMLLGKQTFDMTVPQFNLYMVQRGITEEMFHDMSDWVVHMGILDYRWFSPEKYSSQEVHLSPEDLAKAETELKLLQDRELFLLNEQNNLNDATDALLSEQKTMTPAEFQSDMGEILSQKLDLRSRLIALKYRQQVLLTAVGPARLARQRVEAAIEQKRREDEKATGVAFCAQSMDFLDPSADLKVGARTVDPDDGSVSTVISIAVAKDNMLARHCYIREQLSQYFDSKPQIYEWLAPPVDEWTPPLQLGTKLYQLPLGNTIITRGGHSRLVNPNNPTTQFFLQLLAKDVRMGTLDHTSSAFWNRVENVYEVVPLLEGNVLGEAKGQEAKVQEIKIPDEDELDDLQAMEEADNDDLGNEYPALFTDENVIVEDVLPPDFDDYRGSIMAFLDEHDDFQYYPPLRYALQPEDGGFLPLDTVKSQISLAIWRLFQYHQFYRYVRPELSDAKLSATLTALQQAYENASNAAMEESLPQARQLLDAALRREEAFLYRDVDAFVYLVGLALAIVEGRNTYVGLNLINEMVEPFTVDPRRIINVRTLFVTFFEADQDGSLDAVATDAEEPEPDDANMHE